MKRKNCTTAFLALALLAAVFLAANLCVGSVNIPLPQVLSFLGGGEEPSVSRDIVMKIRFPRALGAAILGGGLALSGYLLQTFFHNPVAGPFILGISSGAKMMVALFMVLSLKMTFQPGFGIMILAAFVGAMISMGFVILMSYVVERMSMLIVCGVMIGYICSAITDFVVAFAEDSDIVNLHNWSKGSFSGIGWEHVKVMAAVMFITFLWVLFLSKQISAYQLGEDYAKSLGLNVGMFRVTLVIVSSILSASVTAFAGPVSFVGIAVPHLIKHFLGTAMPVLMIPACFLGGAVFCLLCDLLARILLAPTELGVSTVTAIFGAPVVLAIMIHGRKHTS
ncbi:MAG: iron ABC transporter permease [Lachnospiraceae bacterium]|jgi:iron complex transport system permease protein|nr:iron ABC transporter permease [Lachnospiraceae bacterium]